MFVNLSDNSLPHVNDTISLTYTRADLSSKNENIFQLKSFFQLQIYGHFLKKKKVIVE